MPEEKMAVFDHLEELRKRILVSLLAILVITACALIFSNTILKFLLIPSGGLRLKAFGLMDGFMIKFRSRCILALPRPSRSGDSNFTVLLCQPY